MAITLKINSVDKTSLVDWKSLTKQQVSSKEPDTLNFDIINYPAKTYRPVLGDDVKLYDTDGTTLIFGGTVINTEEKMDGLVKYFTVNCKDYTHTLDRNLVVKNYTNQTVSYIVNDLLTTYAPTFTKTNTTDTTIITAISFNYLPISECLKKLAKTLGHYSWYVDYTKDINFFANYTKSAPFNLTDTSQNYIWGSLIFRSDISQLRNHIILRGGTTTGTSYTDYKIADGKQNTFFVGYDLVSYTFYKALAGTPTTFVTLTVGDDGVTDPTTVDVVYNPTTGLVRFANSNTPAVNDVVKWIGTPTYPLIAQKLDVASIATFGTYQQIIVDTNITSVDSASQRLTAELAKWSAQIDGGEFETTMGDLIAGQTITVQSDLRNINQNFKIDRILTKLKTPTTFIYRVEIITTDNVTMQDILNKLLVTDVSDNINIGLNEVLQVLYSATETVTISEVVSISTSSNPQSETVTLGESVTVQALDYGVIFVVGSTAPNGFKRQFTLDGSPLG